MYSSAVFTGVNFFALKFYLDWVILHQPFLRQKTRDTGLPDGEDPHPSAFPRLDTIPDCDRQTDGYAVAYTTLANLALRRIVISIETRRFSGDKVNKAD